MIITNHTVERTKLVKEALLNNSATGIAFGALTYDTFCSGVAPSFDTRTAYERSLNVSEGIRQEIDNADEQSAPYVQRMVDGIKCHPDYGPNSPLYVQCGYTAQNQRRSGLTRPANNTPPTGESTPNQ